MLRQQSLLLALDYVGLSPLLSLGDTVLFVLHSSFLPKDRQLCLPQALDFTSVLKLTHSPLLLVHLFQALVFSEFLQQLLFKVFFKALFLGCPLSLKPHLEFFGLLKLTFGVVSLVLFGLSTCASGQLRLFIVELIAQILLELLLGSSSHLLSLKSLKNSVTSFFSRIFSRLNLIQALLLLLGILTHHLIFKGFHFLLTPQQSPFLIDREDHIGLSLLLLEVLNASHLSILVDHPLNDVVDLLFFSEVFLLCFGFQILMLIDLALDAVLVLNAVL